MRIDRPGFGQPEKIVDVKQSAYSGKSVLTLAISSLFSGKRV